MLEPATLSGEIFTIFIHKPIQIAPMIIIYLKPTMNYVIMVDSYYSANNNGLAEVVASSAGWAFVFGQMAADDGAESRFL